MFPRTAVRSLVLEDRPAGFPSQLRGFAFLGGDDCDRGDDDGAEEEQPEDGDGGEEQPADGDEQLPPPDDGSAAG